MAIQPNRLAGIAYITVNGQTMMLAADLAYSVSSVSRETLVGQDTVHGYAEKPSQSYIHATLRDSGKLSLAQINAWNNVTVVCELANGKTVIGRNMWTTEVQEVKTTEGSFEVKFEGVDVQEA